MGDFKFIPRKMECYIIEIKITKPTSESFFDRNEQMTTILKSLHPPKHIFWNFPGDMEDTFLIQVLRTDEEEINKLVKSLKELTGIEIEIYKQTKTI